MPTALEQSVNRLAQQLKRLESNFTQVSQKVDKAARDMIRLRNQVQSLQNAMPKIK